MEQPSHSRRRFLLSAASLAAATTLPKWFLEETALTSLTALRRAPGDRPGVALIGCGGRGLGIAREASAFGDIVAVCDVDEAHRERAKQLWPKAESYGDFRKPLERADVHVVVNGTPDHWHTLVNLAAVRSGKDVYSEKPLTLTIEEGQRLVKAVQASKQILQTGSQQRSDRHFRLACELVRNGRLGKLRHIDVWLPEGRREGPFPTGKPPAGFDWNMWLGPTPLVDYVPERTHVTFRYWWEYSGGTLTDWGAHHLDIALWGAGHETSGPVRVEGRSLKEMIPGGFTAASQYEIEYQFADGLTQSCRSTPANAWNGAVVDPAGQQHGVKFHGETGAIFVSRGRIEASDPELLTTPLPAGALRLYASDNHMANFFDCVHSRGQPICSAEIGHRSVSVCHLGVIALRLGRALEWDPAAERFPNDNEANAWLAREMRRPWTFDSI